MSQQYDPGRMALSWNGIRIFGFAADTFIKAERDEDSFKKEIGADGFAVRVQTRNKGGKVTFTLQAQSPVNDLLAAAMLADEEAGETLGPLLLKDLSGTTFAEADEAWLVRPASMEFSQAGGTREWMLDCSELVMHAGGATR